MLEFYVMENFDVILLDFLIAFCLVGVLSFVVGYVIDRLHDECDLMNANTNEKPKHVEGRPRNLKWQNRIRQFSENGVVPFERIGITEVYDGTENQNEIREKI